MILTIKKKRAKKAHIEDEKDSQSYRMEAVAFFDKLNFDDPNNDKSEIGYIKNSI